MNERIRIYTWGVLQKLHPKLLVEDSSLFNVFFALYFVILVSDDADYVQLILLIVVYVVAQLVLNQLGIAIDQKLFIEMGFKCACDL